MRKNIAQTVGKKTNGQSTLKKANGEAGVNGHSIDLISETEVETVDLDEAEMIDEPLADEGRDPRIVLRQQHTHLGAPHADTSESRGETQALARRDARAG